MSDSAQKNPQEELATAPEPPRSVRDQALFSNLFATKPVKQRKLGPIVIAALLHIPLLFLFFSTEVGERMLERAERMLMPVILDEPPVAVQAPEPARPELAPAPPPAVRPAPVEEERERVAPIPTPGPPNPAAVPTPGAGAPATPPGIVPGVGQPRTVLERLNAPPVDSRLLAPPDAGALATGVETSRDRLAAKVSAFNDSIMAERAADSRARDWTTTDSEGRTWGARDGKIYIAGVAIPIPVAMATPPGRRDEVNSRNRVWAEIEAGASRAEIKDSFEDRVKEIRKRKEAERAAAKKKTVTN